MLEEIHACVARRESFAFETTLSGLVYLRHIREWRRTGWHISLYFLSLPTQEMAIARVAERVRQGGHGIAEAIVRRRFIAGWRNFTQYYRGEVDSWALYDNAHEEPILIEWGETP